MSLIVKVLIVVVVGIPALGIGAAYCAASLNRQRMAGNEAMAIGTLRAIVSAQMAYSTDCMGAYAPTLERLAARGLVDPSLGSDPVERAGYAVTLRGGAGATEAAMNDSACDGAVSSFDVIAVPIEPGSSGVRFFKADDAGDVVQATSATFAGATPLD